MLKNPQNSRFLIQNASWRWDEIFVVLASNGTIKSFVYLKEDLSVDETKGPLLELAMFSLVYPERHEITVSGIRTMVYTKRNLDEGVAYIAVEGLLMVTFSVEIRQRFLE
jgi:hypothetical protein